MTRCIKEEELPEERNSYPEASRLQILHVDKEVVSHDDPSMKLINDNVEKIISIVYFKTEGLQVGTAFFCRMKKGEEEEHFHKILKSDIEPDE